MTNLKLFALCCALLSPGSLSVEVHQGYEAHSEVTVESDSSRGRRGVIEEEKFYNVRTENHKEQAEPWMPAPSEDATTKISIANDDPKDVLPLYQTTERVTDKPTGRGARAFNENWIKLPYPGQEENSRDDVLTPPQPSGELINSRMPRINFVTQNKPLEASESRNDKEAVQRVTRTDDVRDIRTDFVRPGEDDRAKLYKPLYPRQAVYYPEESRRSYYNERYYPADDLYRRDPYYDNYDRRRYIPPYGPRVDRYDDVYDNYLPRKPKRIIYYAHLPDVVRTPPSVDLRYRYSADPYRRFDDDYYARTGRYDYRFRNKYPYAPLRKEERNYRDLAGSGTVTKDKKVEEKVTPTPILPEKEDKYKKAMEYNRNANRNLINSHQYHDGVVVNYNEPVSHKGFQDVVRQDDTYIRYDEPLFQGTVEDPYQRKY